jgi:hypothetical protein
MNSVSDAVFSARISQRLAANSRPTALILTQARQLDARADIELQFGRHVVAERLAHQAAELREVAQ